jgi:hypothetical protein
MNDLSGTFNNVATSYGNAAGKNKFINGDFGVWQRGTSFTSTGGAETYCADRWVAAQDGGTSVATQQTFTPGTAPVAGYEGQYFLQFATTVSGTNNLYLLQKIEDVRTFANQTITLSYWAKTTSGTVTNTPLYIQGFGSGGSGIVAAAIGSSSTITTSWQRFTHTVAVPSISGKTIGTSSFFSIQVLRFAASATVQIWGVQVEAGSIATPFATASGGSIQGELAMCQRYYVRELATAAFGNYAPGQVYDGTRAQFIWNLPVTLRTSPTVLETTGTASNYRILYGSSAPACSVVPSLDVANTQRVTILGTVASGLTAANACFLSSNNLTTGYLGVSAEL